MYTKLPIGRASLCVTLRAPATRQSWQPYRSVATTSAVVLNPVISDDMFVAFRHGDGSVGRIKLPRTSRNLGPCGCPELRPNCGVWADQDQLDDTQTTGPTVSGYIAGRTSATRPAHQRPQATASAASTWAARRAHSLAHSPCLARPHSPCLARPASRPGSSSGQSDPSHKCRI
jgi:hypothetical protein